MKVALAAGLGAWRASRAGFSDYSLHMEVFLSWSKTLSHEVAKYFAEWLPGVIQECSDPFISSDTAKGEPWFETITTNLQTTDIGIVFITSANMDASWLNFESGAMLNKFGKSGVCPVLIDLKKEDYAGPMKNLQLTEIGDKEDMRLLLRTINDRCAKPLGESLLTRAFEQSWVDLVDTVSDACEKQGEEQPTSVRSLEDKVDEILLLVRQTPNSDALTAGVMASLDERSRATGRTAAETRVADIRRKEKLKDFETRYGSLDGFRKSDKLTAEVVNFKEDSDSNLIKILARSKDGVVFEVDANDFEIFPF